MNKSAKKTSKTIDSRKKGITGELEVCKLFDRFHDNFEKSWDLGGVELPKCKRNLQQTREGGHDILGPIKLAVEVKRVEKGNADVFWNQTVEQAKRVNKLPILFYRKNNSKWVVRLYVVIPLFKGDKPIKVFADIDLYHFNQWYQAVLYRYYSKRLGKLSLKEPPCK